MSSNSADVRSESSVRNSKSAREMVVTDADIMCGVVPANPAERMVKYSSSDAVAGAASGLAFLTWLLWIVPPAFIRSPIVTMRVNAVSLARSFVSFVRRMISGRMLGMKASESLGNVFTISLRAASRSLRAGMSVVSVLASSIS